MKNRLEAELISIAHRILKLKGRVDIVALQKETLNLYEKLSVLKFIEENQDDVLVNIPSEITEKLNNTVPSEIAISEKVSVQQTNPKEFVSESSTPEIRPEIQTREAQTQESEKPIIDLGLDIRFNEFETQLTNAKPTQNPAVFDTTSTPDLFASEPLKQSEPKVTSINDTVKKQINIGLNDRIAFEFHLFGGSSEDLNRILSQLQTFETYQEAKNFIQNVIKPDYNNWVNKDEYEARLLEIIENRFL